MVWFLNYLPLIIGLNKTHNKKNINFSSLTIFTRPQYDISDINFTVSQYNSGEKKKENDLVVSAYFFIFGKRLKCL